ncbi:MAG: GerMN domain-containing protein [Actinomycetota bacterium]|nr:GerMN domain-containing protein [Actinomycetota bacterium]
MKPRAPQKQQVEVLVYYPIIGSDGGYMVGEARSVPSSAKNIPKSAIEHLITGKPTKGSHGPYMRSINPDTKVLDLTIRKGLATVDFNRVFLDAKVIDDRQADLAVAAIVKTLSQFPKVKEVMIAVEGKTSGKVGGKDIEDLWGSGLLKKQPFSVSSKEKETGQNNGSKQ